MEKEPMNKKMKILIAVLILLIVFVCCGIFIKSTPKTREEEIISYLEDKYKTEFEIIQITDSGEKVLFAEQSCDGSTFCPEIRDKGTIMYEYEIKSLSDDIVFGLEYEDGKWSDSIKSLYFAEKYSGELLKDIGDYIIDSLGDENAVLKISPLEEENDGTFESSGGVHIYIDQELNKVVDKEYVNKVQEIPEYVREKVKGEDNIELSIYIDYADGMRIWFNERNYSEVLYDLTTDDDSYLDYDLTEYLERLNK